MLDECGVEWKSKINCDTYWYGQDKTFYKFTEHSYGITSFSTCQWNLTPKHVLTAPIAATVGNRTDLSKRLREVNGLHEFAELFGFDWADDSDWTWHDVACAMADEIDVATDNRSCAFCPEMDNPDSYIRHLQSALKWHDEHVPRPTNPINTCVVLEGEKVPEEVLFIGANGVTHYLPEATCRQEEQGWSTEGDHARVWLTCGHDCMVETVADLPKFCQECGARVVDK